MFSTIPPSCKPCPDFYGSCSRDHKRDTVFHLLLLFCEYKNSRLIVTVFYFYFIMSGRRVYDERSPHELFIV